MKIILDCFILIIIFFSEVCGFVGWKDSVLNRWDFKWNRKMKKNLANCIFDGRCRCKIVLAKMISFYLWFVKFIFKVDSLESKHIQYDLLLGCESSKIQNPAKILKDQRSCICRTLTLLGGESMWCIPFRQLWHQPVVGNRGRNSERIRSALISLICEKIYSKTKLKKHKNSGSSASFCCQWLATFLTSRRPQVFWVQILILHRYPRKMHTLVTWLRNKKTWSKTFLLRFVEISNQKMMSSHRCFCKGGPAEPNEELAGPFLSRSARDGFWFWIVSQWVTWCMRYLHALQSALFCITGYYITLHYVTHIHQYTHTIFP